MLLAAALLTALAAAPPTSSPAIKSFEGVTEYRLESGLRLLVVPDLSRGSFTVLSVPLNGWVDDPTGQRGMSHLIEHVSALGTANHPTLPDEISPRGDLGDAFTAIEHTGYVTTLPYSEDNLRFAVEVEADRIAHPLYTAERITRELGAMRQEQSLVESDFEDSLLRAAFSSAFADHSYRNIGVSEELGNITPEKMLAFHAATYRPDNLVLVISGPVKPADAFALVSKTFSGVRNPTAVKYTRSERPQPQQQGERRFELSRAGNANAVLLAYRGPSALHQDHAALAVLAQILGGGKGGGLKELPSFAKTEARISVALNAFSQASLLSVFAEAPKTWATGQLEAALKSGLAEFLATLTPQAVEKAKAEWSRRWEHDFNDSLTTSKNVAAWQANGDWRGFFLLRNRIRKVTAADVVRVAKAYLVTANQTVGVTTSRAEVAESAATGIPKAEQLELELQGEGTAARQDDEPFDWSASSLQARTQRGKLAGGLQFALLPVRLRGGRATISLTLHSARPGAEPALVGLASDMLLRGTRALTSEQLEARLRELNASAEVVPAFGGFTILLESEGEHAEPLLELLAELVSGPRWDAKEFETAKSKALDAVTAAERDVKEQTRRGCVAQLYRPGEDGRPYFQTVAEQLVSTRGASLASVSAAYRSLFASAAGELVVIGTHDSRRVRTLLDGLLGKLQLPGDPRPIESARIAAEPVRFAVPSARTGALCLGGRFDNPSAAGDFPALQLGALLLATADYSVSRVGKRVRMRDHLSFFAVGSIGDGPRFPMSTFQTLFTFEPSQREAVLAALREEFEKASSDPFSEAELTLGKGLWQSRRRVRLASPKRLAALVTSQLMRGSDFQEEAAISARIDATSAAEVTSTLQRRLSFQSLSLSSAAP